MSSFFSAKIGQWTNESSDEKDNKKVELLNTKVSSFLLVTEVRECLYFFIGVEFSSEDSLVAYICLLFFAALDSIHMGGAHDSIFSDDKIIL